MVKRLEIQYGAVLNLIDMIVSMSPLMSGEGRDLRTKTSPCEIFVFGA